METGKAFNQGEIVKKTGRSKKTTEQTGNNRTEKG